MRGRIRSVKPEVHTDEVLWDLEERTGLPLFRAFVGLWNFADREGRFEWRPRALKVLVLPYWSGDMAAVLDALAEGDFVFRYEVDGKAYGQIRTFVEHQSPNHREPPSRIPAPEIGEPKQATCEPEQGAGVLEQNEPEDAQACPGKHGTAEDRPCLLGGEPSWEPIGEREHAVATPHALTSKPPVAGASGAHNQEVREGWAEAYAAAGAGAAPHLAGQQFAAAVAFASSVSRAHKVPLRQAARDIATAVLRRGDKRPAFAFAELDPYANNTTPRRKSLAELRPGFVPNPGA